MLVSLFGRRRGLLVGGAACIQQLPAIFKGRAPFFFRRKRAIARCRKFLAGVALPQRGTCYYRKEKAGRIVIKLLGLLIAQATGTSIETRCSANVYILLQEWHSPLFRLARRWLATSKALVPIVLLLPIIWQFLAIPTARTRLLCNVITLDGADRLNIRGAGRCLPILI